MFVTACSFSAAFMFSNNMKQHEKDKTQKKCYGASQKKDQDQKSATRKKLQHEKSTICEKCNTEKVQHEMSATRKKVLIKNNAK